MSWYRQWAPYVPVARRRANAAAYAAKLAKKEKRTLAPIHIEGRAIASSFWGIPREGLFLSFRLRWRRQSEIQCALVNLRQ